MSATQLEHVIQVPAKPASEGKTIDSVPDDPADEVSCETAMVFFMPALLIAAVVVFIPLIILTGFPTEYSAAITGATGIGSSTASPDTILRLFNLTVHINNPSRLSAYCVPSGTTAAVSYDGATVGNGTVPMLCAGKRDEGEVVVPVWGADVTLALDLQRLKGVVDVVIQMPHGNDPHLFACSVRVGRGLAPCTSHPSLIDTGLAGISNNVTNK